MFRHSPLRLLSRASCAVATTGLIAHCQTRDCPVSFDVLRRQDDSTSNGVINFFTHSATFQRLAMAEGDAIRNRDQEDADKLAAGIKQSISNGVLPADLKPAPYKQIDVLGKSAEQVAQCIIDDLPVGRGCVVILVGLSGTGKGTAVSKLCNQLPNTATWSNGNIFRSLTLLAATHCEQRGIPFDASVLTPQNLQTWMSYLKFGKFNGKFDIHICGLGLNVLVSEVANTTLKEPKVSKNIPTVAKVTQGEVVKFAAGAVTAMGEDGMTVLLEGREQTVDFIPSPYRFCLCLSDTSLIGKRRAAQVVAAAALRKLSSGASEQQVASALQQSCDEMWAQHSVGKM